MHHNCLGWPLFVPVIANTSNKSSAGKSTKSERLRAQYTPDLLFWMPISAFIEPYNSNLCIFLIKNGLLHLVVKCDSWCLPDSPSISPFTGGFYTQFLFHILCGDVVIEFYGPNDQSTMSFSRFARSASPWSPPHWTCPFNFSLNYQHSILESAKFIRDSSCWDPWYKLFQYPAFSRRCKIN